jgi:hypothetical protein
MKLNTFKFFIFFIILLLLLSSLFLGCTKKYYRIEITRTKPATELFGDSKIKFPDSISTEDYYNVRKIIDIGDNSVRFIDEDGEERFLSDKEITKIEVFTFFK